MRAERIRARQLRAWFTLRGKAFIKFNIHSAFSAFNYKSDINGTQAYKKKQYKKLCVKMIGFPQNYMLVSHIFFSSFYRLMIWSEATWCGFTSIVQERKSPPEDCLLVWGLAKEILILYKHFKIWNCGTLTMWQVVKEIFDATGNLI